MTHEGIIKDIEDILSEWEYMRKHGVGISRYEVFNRRCIKVLKKIKESVKNEEKY